MKRALIGFIMFMSGVICFSCGGTDSSTSPSQASYTYGGTQAPGDYWEWDISWESATSGTFTAKNFGTTAGKTVSFTYSGTTSLLESKFTKFAVSETDDSSVTVGSAFYGVEIPGTAVLVQTAGTPSEFITCSVIGTVPTAASTYNWTRIPDAATMNNQTTTAGVVSYGTSEISLVSGTAYQSKDKVYDWDKALVDDSTSSMTLFESKLFSPDTTNPVCVTLMAPSGCFVIDMGTDGGYFGSIAPASDIDIDDLVSHEFRGYCTIYNSSTSADVMPIYCKPSTTAKQMLSAAYSDVEAGTMAPSGECAVDFGSAVQPNPGLLFDVSSVNPSPGFDESIVTAIAKVGGKYVFSGFGRVKYGTSEPYRWENFIMIQVD